MKKILSMVLTLALVLTSIVIPASATTEATPVEVDITSITEGQILKAGAVVRLAADASSLTNVKNIDFYANDSKLPGTILGNKGEILWYAQAEGVYDITTQVTYNTNTDAKGTEKVRVVVLPPNDDKIVPIWPDGGELEVQGTAICEYVEDFAVFGTKALKIIPKGDVRILFDGRDNPHTWNRMAAAVYVPEAIEGLTVFQTNALGSSGQYNSGTSNECELFKGNRNVYAGMNRYVTDPINKGFEGILDWAAIGFTGATADNEKPIYLLGFYGMSKEGGDYPNPVVPVATAEIGDNATDVCNEMEKYRINFNSAIFADGTKAPAEVTDPDGNIVELESYTYGTNYVDLHLPKLANNTKYTVKIPANTILSYYSGNTRRTDVDNNTYVAETIFTFTTKEDQCGAAKPVIKMSYPAPGASCLTDSSFAAQVVAPNSTINKVKFYKGDVLLGEGVEMTEREWWLETPNADVLTLGENVVTVKMFDETDTQLGDAVSATYSVAEKPEYFVKGIYNGAVIVLQEEESRTITVVDAANNGSNATTATSIDKVEIYKGTDLVDTLTTAPYTYELKFDSFGKHKFEARIYDVYGNVYDDFVSEYTVVSGTENSASFTQNFDSFKLTDENGNAVDNTAALQTAMIEYNDEESKYNCSATTRLTIGVEEHEGSKKMKIQGTGSKKGSLQIKGAAADTGHKVHYYKFDIASSYGFAQSIVLRGDKYSDATHEMELLDISKNGYLNDSERLFPDTETIRTISIILDYNDAPMATILVDGTEWNRVSLADVLDGTGEPAFVVSTHFTGDPIYIDNFEYTVYDVYEKFGLHDFNNEFIFENHGTEEEPDYTKVCKFITSASNSTNAPVTVMNLLAAYDGEGRLIIVYPQDHKQWKDGTEVNVNVTYQPGAYKQENVLRCGVGDPAARSAKLFTFVVNADSSLDIAPIGKFAE